MNAGPARHKPVQVRTAAAGAPVADHPAVDLCLRNRGVASRAEADLSLSSLLPPDTMRGIPAAAARLADAIDRGEHIVVLGDYDCDGATGTSITVDGLRRLGARNVDYVLPNRVVHGYGLSPAIARELERHRPDVVMTVDNGIASVDGANVVAAFRHACDLVVTDHHLPAAASPKARAIVNPNQQGCEFPSKHLAGVGVAFYVVAATRAELVARNRFRGSGAPPLAPLLDRVALGTVADLVTLDRNNRIIVREGLQRMRRGEACPGINALAAVARTPIHRLTERDLGFGIAPRINAAGRLKTMDIGVDCLLETSDMEALALAQRLDQSNLERRARQAEASTEVVERIGDNIPRGSGPALCARDESWHEGIVGLVASRLVEKYGCPSIVFGGGARAGVLKGSCRTVPGLHIKHVLDAVNARLPDAIVGFGGHAMAAGLSLRADAFDAFAEAFEDEVARQITPEVLRQRIEVDAIDPPAEWLNIGATQALEQAGPWGMGFPPPLFAGSFDVVSTRILKEKHVEWMLRPAGADSGAALRAVQFRADENCMHWGTGEFRQPMHIHCAFSLRADVWRGEERFQLQVEHTVPAEALRRRRLCRPGLSP